MHGCVAQKNLLHRLMFFRKGGCHLRRSSCIIPCLKGCRLSFAPAAAPWIHFPYSRSTRRGRNESNATHAMRILASPLWNLAEDENVPVFSPFSLNYDSSSRRWSVSGQHEWFTVEADGFYPESLANFWKGGGAGSLRTVSGVWAIMGSIIFHFNSHFTSIHKSNYGGARDYFGRGFR